MITPPPQVPRCLACGYDRSGFLHTPTCPECGYSQPPNMLVLHGHRITHGTGQAGMMMLLILVAVVSFCAVFAVIGSLLGRTSSTLIPIAGLLHLLGIIALAIYLSRRGQHLILSPEGYTIRRFWRLPRLTPFSAHDEADARWIKGNSFALRILRPRPLRLVPGKSIIEFRFTSDDPQLAQRALDTVQAGIARVQAAQATAAKATEAQATSKGD